MSGVANHLQPSFPLKSEGLSLQKNILCDPKELRDAFNFPAKLKKTTL